jgi:hypothetical protein
MTFGIEVPAGLLARANDRVNGGMFASGTKRTIRPHPRLSAIGVTADVGRTAVNKNNPEGEVPSGLVESHLG